MNKQEISKILKISALEIPNRNFDERIMQKIEFAYYYKKQRDKNIRLSWIFLGASTILFPTAFLLLMQNSALRLVTDKILSLKGIGQSIMPAIILLSAIIILLQIDNLYRLTLKTS